MEFSKFIPRTKPFVKRVKSSSLHIDPVFVGGMLFTLALVIYFVSPTKIHHGVNKLGDYVLYVVSAGFNALIIIGILAALGFAAYKIYQVRQKQSVEYGKKKREMIKQILKAVYNSSRTGVPVKQLRDRLIPPYS